MAPPAIDVFREPGLKSKRGLLGFMRALLAEFLGTLMFVLISTGLFSPCLFNPLLPVSRA